MSRISTKDADQGCQQRLRARNIAWRVQRPSYAKAIPKRNGESRSLKRKSLNIALRRQRKNRAI
jgi:hypothetical protein